MISVIIPSLNSPLIDQVISALQQQTFSEQIAEIIVVGQDCHGLVPENVRFIVTKKLLSAAAARNLGAKLAQSKYLFFLDSDCLAAPDLIEQLLQSLQTHEVVSGSVELETTDFWLTCDNLLVFAEFLETCEAGQKPYLLSLNLGIERKLFQEIGGFAEKYVGAAGEDLDFSLRLLAKGYSLYFEPKVKVIHRPQRASAALAWQHLRVFGRVYYQIQRSYPSLRSPLAKLNQQWAAPLLALAPFFAFWDTLRFFAQNRVAQRYLYTFWGIFWLRIGWYWGVLESCLLQPAK